MSYDTEYIPEGLERGDDNKVRIRWKDGVTTEITGDFLRSKCPCASCVEEWTGEVKVTFEDVRGVTIQSMKQLGTYAFSIVFSDGHQTGIFTFKTLRELSSTV